ncbi:MAG: leucine-rich repeat domain-containing protein [Spirochaetaceae bacterium]|nr:leucine-rich repeat domain-containing protein [Spirochaetaceae bacterium]
MKKFLQIFALCALCVLAAPMVFARNDEPVITATKDNVYDTIRLLNKSATIELIGEIDTETISKIKSALGILRDKSFITIKEKINLDLSKTTGLKELPEKAFFYCLNLKSITIPSSVESIGDEAFMYSSNLTQIIVDENNTNYKSINGVLYSKDESVLICYPAQKSARSFMVSENVKTIAKGAFCGIANLEEFFVEKDNDYFKAVDGVLYNKDGTLLVSYPSNRQAAAFVVPDGTESIAELAFYRCKLKNLTFSGNTKTICDYAFVSCHRLENVTFQNGLKSIGNYAFDNCCFLKKVVIPDSLENIGKGGFYECERLKSITIPCSVRNIGGYAFYHCKSLKSIQIPDGIDIISDGIFCGCKNLESVIIPASVKEIGRSAFANCSKLRNINLPANTKKIGSSAFENCKSITNIKIPDNVDNIEAYVFDSCINLKDVMIPDGIEEIGDKVFRCCSSLRSITIPSNVKSIGKWAFGGCKNLKTINYKGSDNQWKQIIKGDNWNGNCPSPMKINYNYTEN